MNNLDGVVNTLRKEREEAQQTLTRLDTAITALSGTTANHTNHTPGKRHMSASARQRIADAQRARWAKWKKQQRRG
jgi:hypothetical protein